MRFDDVSLFEHLITTAHDSIHRIRPPWTHALVEEDERLQGALLETLQVYLQSRMSAKATASTLDVHVNTIYHRLHRIEDISTRRTSSVVDVLDLIVALRLSAQRI
jgi:sugar diacid utilization regulator